MDNALAYTSLSKDGDRALTLIDHLPLCLFSIPSKHIDIHSPSLNMVFQLVAESMHLVTGHPSPTLIHLNLSTNQDNQNKLLH